MSKQKDVVRKWPETGLLRQLATGLIEQQH